MDPQAGSLLGSGSGIEPETICIRSLRVIRHTANKPTGLYFERSFGLKCQFVIQFGQETPDHHFLCPRGACVAIPRSSPCLPFRDCQKKDARQYKVRFLKFVKF